MNTRHNTLYNVNFMTFSIPFLTPQNMTKNNIPYKFMLQILLLSLGTERNS